MDHLPGENFVFISDDANNRSIALEEGIQAFSGMKVLTKMNMIEQTIIL